MPFESEAQRAFMFANHPGIAKRFEEETPENAELPERVPHLYDGGFMNDPRLQPQMPFPPAPPEQDTGFRANSGLPQSPPTPGAPASPVSPNPDELSKYFAQRSAALDKYGPEQQMEVEREIQKRRSGAGQIAGNAMTGLADALMQGVARAGPGNFQANLQNRLEKRESGMRSAMKDAQTGQLAKVKQEMELDQLDPNSSFSKIAQRAYGSSLKTMPGGQGLTDATISRIPASMIADILSKKVDLAKAIAEVESTQAWRDATLGVQRDTATEAVRYAKEQEAIAKTGQQTEADKILANRSGTRRAVDFLTGNPAVQRLQGVAGGFDPEVMEYARIHGISPQNAQIKKERWMQKNQATGGQ